MALGKVALAATLAKRGESAKGMWMCPICHHVSRHELQAKTHEAECVAKRDAAQREKARLARRGSQVLHLTVTVLEAVGLRAEEHATREAAAQPPGDQPVASARLSITLESTGMVQEAETVAAKQTGFAAGEVVEAMLLHGSGRGLGAGAKYERCEVLGPGKTATSLFLHRLKDAW